MTTEEMTKLKTLFPEAMLVWHDRMHDLEKGQLIETLLVHMTPHHFSGLLAQINKDIKAEGEHDRDQG